MNARTELKMTWKEAVMGYFKYPTKPRISEPSINDARTEISS